MIKSRIISLSHPLSAETPGFGGKNSFISSPLSEIDKGASSNSSYLSFSGHLGTHIDFPRHFFLGGNACTDYPPENWIFSKVHVSDLDLVANELIEVGGWTEEIPHDTEFLILKTKFQRFRGQEIYWRENPGLTPDLANWLKRRCPSMRAIGFDFISASAFQHREVGRAAHKAFLGNQSNREEILIVEDMKLDALYTSPSRVVALPLLIEGADGVPINIVAEIA